MRISLLILGIFFLNSCNEEKPATLSNKDIEDLSATNTLWNFSMRLMDTSHTKAMIWSERARVYDTQQQSNLDGHVIVDFFGVGNSRAARLSSDSAEIDNRTNNMWAKGNVVVVADNSKTILLTSELFWDNKRRKLYTNKYVKINRPGEEIQGGYGFESDEYLLNYRIFDVQGRKQ